MKKDTSIDRGLLKRLGHLYLPFRWPVCIALVVMFMNQFISLIPAFFVGMIVDELMGSARQNVLFGLVGGMGIAKILNTLIVRWRINYELRHIDFKLPQRFAEQTLRGLLRFSPGQNRNHNSGKIQGIVDKGEKGLASLLPLLIFNIVPILTQIIVAAIALIWLDWSIGLLVCLMIGVYSWVLFRISRVFDSKLDTLQDVSSWTNSLRMEIGRNLPAIQLVGQEPKSEKRYHHRLSRNTVYNERMWQGLVSARNLTSLIVYISEPCILALAVWFTLTGKYGPGTTVVLFMWMTRSSSGIAQLANFHKQLLEYVAAIKKYFIVMDIKPAVCEVSNPVRLTTMAGRIQFLGVSFRYPDTSGLLTLLGEKPNDGSKTPSRNGALRDITLTIEPGERVALVGESGAGKSTIVSLLLRAYDPDEGAITVDGHDLRMLSLRTFRERVGFVEQDVTLWDSTLQENILYGVSDWQRELITRDDISDIVEASRINAFRDRLTDGLQTKVGEKGVFLSGGERQRVGIARALIKNPSILVLDEATSHLDAINERHIKEAIDVASAGRTTIIIAHRLSTVRDADKIVVMSKGRIVDIGTHDDLVARSETYQELVASQLA